MNSAKIAGVAAVSLAGLAWYIKGRFVTPVKVSEPIAPIKGNAQPVVNSPIDIIKGIVKMKPVQVTPRGIRNNNPLNIRKSADNWQGKIGDDGSFVIFDSPYNGIRAAGRLLRTYANNYSLNTIRGIINRWAPSTENDTESYINHVESASGIFRDTILSAGDYPAVVSVMIKHENGQNPYDAALIAQAVADGFN